MVDIKFTNTGQKTSSARILKIEILVNKRFQCPSGSMFVLIKIDKKGCGKVLIRQSVGRRCERVRTRGGWLARRGGEFNGRRGAGIRDIGCYQSLSAPWPLSC